MAVYLVKPALFQGQGKHANEVINVIALIWLILALTIGLLTGAAVVGLIAVIVTRRSRRN